MANLFDHLQDTAFNLVTKTMGYAASWTDGQALTQNANVLLNDPTKTATILDQPFNPKMHLMEYKQGDFKGLFELVNSGKEHIVTINGMNYGVLDVNSKFDGKTYVATLQKQ